MWKIFRRKRSQLRKDGALVEMSLDGRRAIVDSTLIPERAAGHMIQITGNETGELTLEFTNEVPEDFITGKDD